MLDATRVPAFTKLYEVSPAISRQSMITLCD